MQATTHTRVLALWERHETPIGGLLLARLMMGLGWKRCSPCGFAAVLADMDEEGRLRAGSTLKPQF
jgi:hypothetical protein